MPFAAALSTATPTARALDEVCTQLRDRQPAGPDLAVAFFSPHHSDSATVIARTLHDRLSPRALIGCVGEAIVGTGCEIEHQPALSVWLARTTASAKACSADCCCSFGCTTSLICSIGKPVTSAPSSPQA